MHLSNTWPSTLSKDMIVIGPRKFSVEKAQKYPNQDDPRVSV